ncbi:Phosphotransferase enzyme [Emydomyces testavorans]|uniref:Phosphotransferase enzyme n=1 Tax=Emydomyces testavorans TaxID=2070801 RepID=A0AAF0IJ29_9EURO|nr:Phosphotransferase enzyme [Emydomyces testavorans]
MFPPRVSIIRNSCAKRPRYLIPAITSPKLRRHATTAPTAQSHHPHDDDFFRYTTGRWLWDEENQLRKRYRRFNVDALKGVAARTLGGGGARRCVAMSKIGEGNFNKVFRMQMDDGRVAMARIPHPNAGPEGYTTASEVATMEFARAVLGIPVPKVLAWNASLMGNPVEAEYIIMEEAEGTLLTEIWHEMKPSEKKDVIEEVVELEKKLVAVGLNLSGSIYFAEAGFAGCKAAQIVTDAPSSIRELVESRFVIGPCTSDDFWEKEKAKMIIDRGPWDSADEFVKAIAYREMAWINQYGESFPLDPRFDYTEGQTSPQAHTDLLERYLSVAPMLLPQSPDLLRPTLWHFDISSANLFVHNGKISSVVDWQFCSVAPLVLQARVPRLVKYRGEKVLQRPDNFEALDQDEKKKVLDQIARTSRLNFYRTQAALENPLMARVLELPQIEFLDYLTACAGDSWNDDDGMLKLRESLLKVQRRWENFGIEEPCPYQFTDEQIKQHLKDGEGFNTLQDFWDNISGAVDREGFTFPENFDLAVDFFSEMRDIGLEKLTGRNREEWELWTRWVVERKREREAREAEKK